MTVNDFYNYLNYLAPFSLQEKYDNSGLLIGDNADPVYGVLLCLDVTQRVVREAAEKAANLIISHHPVIFEPIKRLDKNSVIYNLIKNDINVISAHTNFDKACMSQIMLNKLAFPENGEVLEPVADDDQGFGVIIDLPDEISCGKLLERVKGAFGVPALRYSKGKEMLRRIALCSGSGGGLLDLALSKGADAYITGDVKWNYFVDAENAGFMLIDSGHYGTEHIITEFLEEKLTNKFHGINISISEHNKDAGYYTA